jgi:hypothetical protein
VDKGVVRKDAATNKVSATGSPSAKPPARQ